MARSQRTSLKRRDHPASRNRVKHALGLRSNDENRPNGTDRFDKIQNVVDHRTFGKRVQNLYPSGVHPFSKTRGQDNA